MISAICTVNGQATTSESVKVTAGTTVTIQLNDPTGVNSYIPTCSGTDERNDAATIQASLTINNITKTATFTAPNNDGYGCMMTFISLVIGSQSTITDTAKFGIAVLTTAGLEKFAQNETTEGNTKYGWIPKLNNLVENSAGPLENTATPNPTPDTLALRDASGNSGFNQVNTDAIETFNSGTDNLTITAAALKINAPIEGQGTIISSTGDIRLQSATSILARNNANNADINLVSKNSSDVITLGDASNGTLA